MATLATRKITVFGLAVLILGLGALRALLASGAFGSAGAQPNPSTAQTTNDQTVPGPVTTSGDMFIYSAKVVCVPDLAKRRRSGPGLEPGLYRTAVNVHNP